jgi:Cdc6-like AAA superfamily ATPase
MRTAEGLYHRLVLLVGPSASGKTAILQELAEELRCDSININLQISQKMLELTTRQRALRIAALLEDIVPCTEPIVILDNTEILFDKDLKQDPLRLLQALSRHRVIIASWNGTVSNNRLVYAEPGHPEYQRYDIDDILIETINNASPGE